MSELDAPTPVAFSVLALSASLPSRSTLMHLAVVERQLIMQLLDLADLARLASTCKQLGSESLHPLCGRFHPTAVEPFPRASQVIKPLQLPHLSHLSPVVWAHRPMSVRLDGLCSVPSLDLASQTEALFQRVASFRRVVSLSLWDSPQQWTEEDALRLLSLVRHSVELVWGVRSGSIWLENVRVQQALFSLPRLTAVRGLTTRHPNGALLPSALEHATKLRTILLIPPSSYSVLRPLAALPSLTRLEICCSTEDDLESIEPASLSFPLVRECEVETDHWRGDIDARPILMPFFMGMRALKSLQLNTTPLADCALDCCVQLGARQLPSLQRVVLRDAADVDGFIVHAFLAAFPSCELCIPAGMEEDFRERQFQLQPSSDSRYRLVKLT